MMEAYIYASNHHDFGSHVQVNTSGILCMGKYTCVNIALIKCVL